MDPSQLASELRDALRSAEPRLRMLSDEAASARPDGKWSAKEILGHLIDSAANNHQRFVRMQLAPHLEAPGYQQEQWVRLGHYVNRVWPDLIELWLAYNLHLAHVVQHLDPTTLSNTWTSPDGDVVTLEFVATDYLAHLHHHLDQIFTRCVTG